MQRRSVVLTLSFVVVVLVGMWTGGPVVRVSAAAGPEEALAIIGDYAGLVIRSS